MIKIETGLEIRKTHLIQSLKNTETTNKLRERSSGKYLALEIQQQLNLIEKKMIKANQQIRNNQNSFLPCLHKFIQTKNQQKSTLNKLKNRKIIELLCICLMRIQNKMNLQALNILTYIGVQLQQGSCFQYNLKSYIFRLIYKIWNALNNINVSHNSHHRRSNDISLLLHNSLQYKNFKDQIKKRLLKSELIVEKSFSQILHLQAYSDIKLPQQIHPSLQNYKQLMVNIDKKTITYSYLYPKVLETYMTINQYRFMISKINQIIVPETKCSNFNSTIRLYFTSIFGALISVLLIFISVIFKIQSYISRSTMIVLMSTFSCILIAFSLCIYFNDASYKNPTILHKEMKNILIKFGKLYQMRGMFFQPGPTIEYFYIYIDGNNTCLYNTNTESSFTSFDSSSFQKDSIIQSENQNDLQQQKNKNHKKRISINQHLVPDYFMKEQTKYE